MFVCIVLVKHFNSNTTKLSAVKEAPYISGFTDGVCILELLTLFYLVFLLFSVLDDFITNVVFCFFLTDITTTDVDLLWHTTNYKSITTTKQ